MHIYAARMERLKSHSITALTDVPYKDLTPPVFYYQKNLWFFPPYSKCVMELQEAERDPSELFRRAAAFSAGAS